MKKVLHLLAIVTAAAVLFGCAPSSGGSVRVTAEPAPAPAERPVSQQMDTSGSNTTVSSENTSSRTVRKEPEVNVTMLVSNVRSTYQNKTDMIEKNMEDLEALRTASEDKVDKLDWMPPSSRQDELKRLEEVRDGGMQLISRVEEDLHSLTSDISLEINSMNWASSTTEKEALNSEMGEQIGNFIVEKNRELEELKAFFARIQ
jgi:gas vesicle protein